MNNIVVSKDLFESIKHINEDGMEFWYARELMESLEYKKWQKFSNVIINSMIACESSNNRISDHFTQVGKMVDIGSKAKRKVDDYKLTRYACYLIVQNSDPRKEIVALGQTYFAIQTRKMELTEGEYNLLSDDEKRLYKRKQIKNGNYSLNRTAINAGVKDLAKFHNAGYRGLYNGETADDIAKRKGLRYREEILDYMDREELSANLFRIDQTDAKLKRDNIHNEDISNNIHYTIGKNIREVIKKNGGMMPEDLPTPAKSLKDIKKDDNYKLLS